MASAKLAISLPEDLAAAVRAEAAREGRGVSAWLAEAARRRLRRKAGAAALAAYEAGHGEIRESELDRVRKAWPASR